MPKKKINSLQEVHVKEKNNKQVVKSVAKKKIFSNAPDEHYFILCNGQAIKNVRELADVLECLDDGVFFHHVTFDRNDFASWVKDIFQDDKLADALASVKDKSNTRIIIYRYLLDCAAK